MRRTKDQDNPPLAHVKSYQLRPPGGFHPSPRESLAHSAEHGSPIQSLSPPSPTPSASSEERPHLHRVTGGDRYSTVHRLCGVVHSLRGPCNLSRPVIALLNLDSQGFSLV